MAAEFRFVTLCHIYILFFSMEKEQGEGAGEGLQ